MKKITLLMFAISIGSFAFAQNVIMYGDFESIPSAQTVTENSVEVLMRVAAHGDATTQTANPTVSGAVTVENGMWVKKAPNSGYIKATLRQGLTAPDGSGNTNTCLSITHGHNNSATGLANWYQNVVQQRLASTLDLTKEYELVFDIKVDNETAPLLENVAAKVVAVVRDHANNKQLTSTIDISSTEWVTINRTFNLPAWITAAGAGAVNVTYFGIGLAAEYGLNDDNAKTKYSSVLIDNVSLSLKTSTSLPETVSAIRCVAGANGIDISSVDTNTQISVYNVSGALVAKRLASPDVTHIPLMRGIYIVRVQNYTTKVVVQ